MTTNWIDYAINNKYIQLYPYDNFYNVRYNGDDGGTGRYGDVAGAEWPRTNRKVALKKLKNFNMEKFVSEVKMHITVHASKNIVRFLGLTQEETETTYIMIFEHANWNNLRMFLQKYTKLEWDAKLNLSLDIAKGLSHLHSLNIIHCDLHSDNVVISQVHHCNEPEFIARITDFGSAIVMDEYENDIIDINDIGQIPFTDPRCLNDHNYRRDLQSDIYGLGVIFWEISSNKPPFINFMPDYRGDFRVLCLTMEIIDGHRERRMLLTPEDYVTLYKRCWDGEPSERPNIEVVIETLKAISSGLSTSLEQTKMIEKDNNALKYDINENVIEDEEDEYEIELFNKDQITDIQSHNNINLGIMSINKNKVIIKKLHGNKITLNLNNWFKISKQSDNIIEFLGIFKDENNMFLITPFAHEGNLRDYLKNKNRSLKKKIKIATEITHGIKYLHLNNIIHGNLDPKKILIFGEIAQISDLPLPYEMSTNNVYFSPELYDNIGYVDPDFFLNRDNFKKENSMDIYSLGSLLWEIMSEKIPYSEDRYRDNLQLINKIKEGYREVDVFNIPDIPAEYIDLYKKCWDKNSLIRPKIESVYEKISHIYAII